MIGVEVTVLRKSEAGRDEMGEPIVSWVPEPVENVLWSKSSSDRLEDGDRPEGTEDTVTFHFPKIYALPLSGCRIVLGSRTYDVLGDPIGYMPELTPGKHNRPVVGRRVEG